MNVEDLRGVIDFGIITIREDEFEAVLDRLPRFGSTAGRRWYNFRRLELPNGGEYLTAVVRCTEPGTGEAQAVANDLIEELRPRWLLVVGIAGGLPADEFSLGDVVVSTRIYDLSIEAALQGGEREFALMGGPIHRAAAIVAANLVAMKEVLHGWNDPVSIGIERPCIEITPRSLYGDTAWKYRVRQSLERHQTRTAPQVVAGTIASSDRLIKDVDLLKGWQKMIRQVLAVEMEAAGVYRAAYGTQTPVLAIRGISDVIGLRRDSAWTRYACHSAASFMRAFLLAQPIEPRRPSSDLIKPDQVPPTYKVEELIRILEDRAAMIRRRLAERYSCEQVKHFIERFDHLHMEHIRSLRSGLLIRAHELVQQIHEMSFEKILREDGEVCYIEHPQFIE